MGNDRGPWSVAELADRTGTPVEVVGRLAAVGLLPTDATGALTYDALGRLHLVQFAERRGITVDELIAARDEDLDVLAHFEDLVPSRGQPQDLRRAAADRGIPPDLVDRLQAAMGWDGLDEAHADAADVEALDLVVAARSAGLPDDALMQLVHLYAESMERLADAEIRIFHDYVHEPMRAAGLSGRELAEAAYSISGPLLALIDPVVAYCHRRGWRIANRDHLLRHLVERHSPPAARAGESTAAIVFVDLVSFTPLTAEIGDVVAAEVLHRFSSIVRAASSAHAGRIVKQIGDAFMLVFVDGAHAVRFGLAVSAAVSAEPEFPSVHIGAHLGPVLFRDGDYVGSTVNLAARVAAESEPGELLVTAAVRHAASAVPADITPRGERSLRGIPEPVELYAVTPSGAEPARRAPARS